MNSKELIAHKPVASFLDFQLLFEQWTKLADNTHPNTCLYHDLIKRINAYPDLNLSPVDPEILDTNENRLGFGLILSSLFPLSGQEESKILALSKPFEFNPIYATPAFKAQFLTESGDIKIPQNLDYERIALHKMMKVYSLILDQIYGIKINEVHPLIFKVPDIKGITRHFQIDLNSTFVKVIPKDSIPVIISREEICSGEEPNYIELERWQELLPLDLFEFHGFVLMEAQDLTNAQSVATLNEAVLQQDQVSPEVFMNIVEDSVKSLLGRADLKVGLAVLQNIKGRVVMTESRLAYSYLIRQLCDSGCEERYRAVLDFLSEIKKPVFLHEMEEHHTEVNLASSLREMGIEEIILYPLRHNGNLVGVLEVCAFENGIFDPIMIHTLDQLAPSLSVALHRQAENLDQKIKSVIRKNFTAIHPVVEWKFDDIALDYVLAEEEGETPEIKPILFKDVFPLFAAVDVKNSSVERNKAIHDDFVIQLDLGIKILELAGTLHFLPLLESLIDKIEEYKKRITLILLSEEEVRITEFFHSELEPIIRHLSDTFSDLKNPVNEYFDALDPQLQIVNQHRKAFEKSMKVINQTVIMYLDKEEEKIQKMFPHYFEKFKTDGIEYNIYIGQSLVQDQKFDLIYLKNLRLWQLQTLIEIVNLIHEKKSHLPIPLETTQLILAHSTPISISFRLDERKFDVEDAYNIRYEIMKKRIDKALILGTNERLVQPGKIAIVYSQYREAKEYLDFINFLQNKGSLEEKIEELELEEMQGVHGLKALRVTVILRQVVRLEKMSKLIADRKEG